MTLPQASNKITNSLHIRFDDCYTAVQKVKETKPDDPILLVGSSMGGWISLKMAVSMPELIKGMLLIAPATNFMRKKYQQQYQSLSKDQQSILDKGETVVSMTPYGYMPIAKRFSEESVEVELDLTKVGVSITVEYLLITNPG